MRSAPEESAEPVSDGHDKRRYLGHHLWEYAVVQDLFWIGALIGVAAAGYLLRSVLTPILVAFGLAYVLNPVVRWGEEQARIPRVGSVLAVILLAAAAVVLFAVMLVPPLVSETVELANHVPTYIDGLAEALEFDRLGWGNAMEEVDLSAVEAIPAMTGGAEVGAKVFGLIVSRLVYVAACLILIPVFYFFFAWRFDDSLKQALNLVPRKHRDRVCELAGRMDNAVGNYLRGRIVAMLFLCVGFSLGWWWTGVPYWLALGIGTGLLGIAPWASVIGWPIAILVKYSEAATSAGSTIDWVDVAVWPSIVFHGVQAVENYVITPWIQSRSMSMSPVTVITAILIGGASGGFYGVLLAIPVVGCTKVLWEEVVFPRWEQWASDA